MMQIYHEETHPPGYFETHSRDGVSWKSTSPVRCKLNESVMAHLTRKFRRDRDRDLRHLAGTRQYPTISHDYTIRKTHLRIMQAPWQSAPVIFLREEDE